MEGATEILGNEIRVVRAARGRGGWARCGEKMGMDEKLIFCASRE